MSDSFGYHLSAGGSVSRMTISSGAIDENKAPAKKAMQIASDIEAAALATTRRRNLTTDKDATSDTSPANRIPETPMVRK
jgi:hypothetical protein